jgi:DNA-binding winged helix-turn-helix (wHTH) protein
MRYEFEPFTLDMDRGLLLKSGEDVAIEPRALELLSLLVVNQDRMVNKDEIVERKLFYHCVENH